MLFLFGFALLAQAKNSEANCPEIEYGANYKRDIETIDDRSEDLIQRDSPVMPEGRLKCHVSYNYSKNNETSRVEKGVYDGIKYRFWFGDGSGVIQGKPENQLNLTEFGNWSTICKRDKIDDTYFCSLQKEDLVITILKNDVIIVTVGSNHYPDSEIAVRVDKNKPFATSSKEVGFSKKQSAQIIEQLKKGKSVTTRYKKWPSPESRDSTIDLFGFNQAYHIVQEIYKAIL